MGRREAGKELWLSLLRAEELHILLCSCKGDTACLRLFLQFNFTVTNNNKF